MNSIAIRREDLSKKGEQRVAITPREVEKLVESGVSVSVQKAHHPDTGERKRAFDDATYVAAGAKISEDIAEADIVFGLKEIESRHFLPNKTWLFFSHTHKGQVKNRSMLQKLVDNKATLIDYELITDDEGLRLVTAFTYFAGYAGMVDSLWTLGQRLKRKGFDTPLSQIKQSVAYAGGMDEAKESIKKAGDAIRQQGLPRELPPLITVFMGEGKTSTGAQTIYDLLPVEYIELKDLEKTYTQGQRDRVYALVLGIEDMFRLKKDATIQISKDEPKIFSKTYRKHPDQFESNLDQIIPYTLLMMNCIIWAPEFPRLLSLEKTREWHGASPTLEVIGDITCDPEGSIEFSHETWIDDPVFSYDPQAGTKVHSADGPGIAVMAVTNLPCEFPADASAQFASELFPSLPSLVKANLNAKSPAEAGFPAELQRATILWKGKFTAPYAYMQDFLEGE
jgi:alpha-aminoadipic semialdehyde synthase